MTEEYIYIDMSSALRFKERIAARAKDNERLGGKGSQNSVNHIIDTQKELAHITSTKSMSLRTVCSHIPDSLPALLAPPPDRHEPAASTTHPDVCPGHGCAALGVRAGGNFHLHVMYTYHAEKKEFTGVFHYGEGVDTCRLQNRFSLSLLRLGKKCFLDIIEIF